MEINIKALTFGVVLGLVGSVVSGAIFFGIMLYSGYAFGLVSVAIGALTGALVALGYKLGGGMFKEKSDVQAIIWISMIMGLLAGINGYFLPYFFFAIIGLKISFSAYVKLLNFGVFDLVFIGISACAARWVLKHAVGLLYKNEIQAAKQKQTEFIMKKLEELKAQKEAEPTKPQKETEQKQIKHHKKKKVKK
jgi:hypothetical protein